MYYYKLDDKYLFSFNNYSDLEQCNQADITNSDKAIYFLTKQNPYESRFSYSVSDPSLLHIEKENLELLSSNNTKYDLNDWLLKKIKNRDIIAINTEYPNWKNMLHTKKNKKWRLNLLALGDVGGTLLTGLRLLGGKYISDIGIYDRSDNKIKRWEYEMNQVFDSFSGQTYPLVHGIKKEELFDCDMFIFCASKSVPPVGSDITDVRMIQLEENSKIITEYAKMARENNFKGVFAVVSDPVDLLCKVALLESNKNNNDEIDLKGLKPEQIRGYGLGVMHARAVYYADKSTETKNYVNEGRAYGPHGEGLIIANSIESYNKELSDYLTLSAKTANKEVRKVGFKPYIAPALSSGTLSIIATISGEWNYSSTYIGGVFFGAKNRLNKSGVELERLQLPFELKDKLNLCYDNLGNII